MIKPDYKKTNFYRAIRPIKKLWLIRSIFLDINYHACLTDLSMKCDRGMLGFCSNSRCTHYKKKFHQRELIKAKSQNCETTKN